jgi:uncharacterized membrane protein YqgA involved in biofilm formation
MGISLIIMLKSLSAVVLALIAGTVIGELLNLEDNLLKGLHRLEERTRCPRNSWTTLSA